MQALAVAGKRRIAQHLARGVVGDAVAAREHRLGVEPVERRAQTLELRSASLDGVDESKAEARGELRYQAAGRAQALRRVQQAPRAAVYRLDGVLEPPPHLARDAARASGDAAEQLGAQGARELRCR